MIYYQITHIMRFSESSCVYILGIWLPTGIQNFDRDQNTGLG